MGPPSSRPGAVAPRWSPERRPGRRRPRCAPGLGPTARPTSRPKPRPPPVLSPQRHAARQHCRPPPTPETVPPSPSNPPAAAAGRGRHGCVHRSPLSATGVSLKLTFPARPWFARRGWPTGPCHGGAASAGETRQRDVLPPLLERPDRPVAVDYPILEPVAYPCREQVGVRGRTVPVCCDVGRKLRYDVFG